MISSTYFKDLSAYRVGMTMLVLGLVALGFIALLWLMSTISVVLYFTLIAETQSLSSSSFYLLLITLHLAVYPLLAFDFIWITIAGLFVIGGSKSAE